MVPTDIHYNNEMEVNERVNLLCANMTGIRIDSNAISIFFKCVMIVRVWRTLCPEQSLQDSPCDKIHVTFVIFGRWTIAMRCR